MLLFFEELNGMVLPERQGLRYANRDFQFPVWDSRRLRRCLVAEFNLEIKGLPKMISFGLMRSFVITEFYCRTNFLSSPKRKDSGKSPRLLEILRL